MKKLILLFLLLGCVPVLKAQDFSQNYSFVNPSSSPATPSFANTGVTSFFMSWSPQTSMNTCSVQADSSSDGSSWGSGDLIASQSCTTAGSATLATLANGKNFVRVHVTAMSGNGGLNVTLKGWGGGGGGGISNVSSLPATCTPGVTAPVNLTVAPYGVYYCSATNVWSSSNGTPLPSTNLISQLPLTDGSGTTPVDLIAGTTWTFGTLNAAPLWNVPIATDNCLGSTLGPFWTAIGNGTIIETGNTCQISVAGTGTFAGAYYNNSSFSNDQYAQVTDTAAPGTGAFGAGVRMNAGTGTSINGYVCYNTNTTMFLAIITTSAATVLNSTARVGANGDIIRLQDVGTTETCTATTSGGVTTTLTASDATYTSGQPGIFGSAVFPTSPSIAKVLLGNTTAPAGGGLYFNAGQFATASAALNSAREIYIYACYQRASNANLYNALIQGNGNGAASNANGLVLTGQVNLNNGPIVQQVPHISILGGSAYGMTPYSNFNGCGVASVTFGTTADRTNDGTFINGLESIYTNNLKTKSGGLQTVGAYQLGGAAAGSGFGTASFLTGPVYYEAAYSAVNDSRTRAQIVQAITQAVVNRGGPAPSLGDTARGDTCVTEGDSITNGFGLASGQVWTQNLSFFTPANGSTFNSGGTSCWNQGVTATTMKQLDAVASYTSLPLMNTAARNVIILWAGTNDMMTAANCGGVVNSCYGATASQVLQSMKHYADQVHQQVGVGTKVIVVPIISRGSAGACTFDANFQAFDPLLRTWWATFADGIVTLDDVPNFATGGCLTNLFQADNIHPSANGQLNFISPLIEREVNTIYGNQDWNSAATYTTTALAATATTAGSEATNTVTLTMGATPANVVVGTFITVAGVTPAGYNGDFLVLTRSATQVTYFNPTSGLGAVSVQGTVVAPQEQDQDAYAILGGSAAGPIHTLETCQGRTKNLPGRDFTIARMITNTNATPWVITPWKAGETINGGATFTAPVAAATNNPVVVLRARQTSPTTGGCTWQASIQ